MEYILNNVIRKHYRKNYYPQYFIDNDEIINDMNDVVNNFNRYFVSVGPKLAGKILDPGSADDWNEKLICRNP